MPEADAADLWAQLYELVPAMGKARGSFIAIEHSADAQIRAIRMALETIVAPNPASSIASTRQRTPMSTGCCDALEAGCRGPSHPSSAGTAGVAEAFASHSLIESIGWEIMMAKAYSMVATAALAMALVGCSQKANEQVADAGNSAANVTEATGNALSNAADSAKEAVTPTPTGQEFADKAAKSDAFEIASAKLAEENAASSEIKSFAAMMIKDHTASTAKIKAAAAKASPVIKPDPVLSDDLNGKLSDLKVLKGADFDKKYAEQQIDAHQSALSLMRLYSDRGDVASLKAAAGAIMPKVETHLEKIKAIRDKL